MRKQCPGRGQRLSSVAAALRRSAGTVDLLLSTGSDSVGKSAAMATNRRLELRSIAANRRIRYHAVAWAVVRGQRRAFGSWPTRRAAQARPAGHAA
jgi:hypothetical protein